MEHFPPLKSVEHVAVAGGVVIKVEEEDVDDPHSGPTPVITAGRAKIKREVKTEHSNEVYIQRRPKAEARRDYPRKRIGRMKAEIKVKLEEEERGYVMNEERDRSPAASPDYFMVQVKEEEEDMSFEMNYQQHTEDFVHPETSSESLREKEVRIHRLSTKMFINIDHLIQMVQERPELYDSKVPSYADRYKRRKAWDEICAVLVPDWELCGDREKNLKVKEVQTRWRSLKDCFRRELTLQKKLEKSGIPPSRRRKYVHYEDLLFLEPTMKIKDTVISNTAATASSNKEPIDTQHWISLDQGAPSPAPLPALPLPIRLLPPAHAPPPAPLPERKSKKKATNKNENEWERQLLSVMSTLRKKSEETVDPDEIFLRNLLPFIKKVPEERKIDMQLGLMHVVKRFMEPVQKEEHQHSTTSSQKNTHHPAGSPRTARSQPPSSNHSAEHTAVPAQQPYSSPSSSNSSSSVNPSPQNHRDSPYYFDL